jgi:DNA-binding MarR family transcriptional regulator
MIERESINQRLPHKGEIENTANVIRSREFLYLTRFADMLNRYVEIKLQDRNGQLNRLKFNTLSLLVVRGGSLPPTQLARHMFRSKHSITNVIDNLEEDGFVTRIRDNNDRRSLSVKITSAGLAFLNQFLDYRAKDEEQIVSCLNKNEIALLMKLIRKLGHRLDEKIDDK